MLEESIPAIWASMHSWFTPTVLFVLLNLVIGTIIATSSGAGQKSSGTGQKSGDKPLARPPSMMERVRSINLHKQTVEDVPAVTVTKPAEPEEISAVEEIFRDGGQSGDGVAALSTGGGDGAGADDGGAAEETPVRRRRMKKWASEKLPATTGLVKEEQPNRRGESVRGHRRVEEFDDDSGGEEVDAKADDFINRFKQQLQLQRMESIMRHKEMLNRGR
ncbi:pathogen-associated molecular patterns-induced protein A70-like [Nymphaea colorata]|uniref:DUF4408 domain-containing protein n=1 Tax=Nymphaea colorata TaxID=210225 RepID=A0A5K0VQU4_9MAGN|nr:pathogen-associated molecular patterns-induced protein A70-like [Nymphaea colorata]